jgi:hypothetical protein
MDFPLTRRDIFVSDMPSHEKSALARVLSRVPGYAKSAYGTVRSHVVATGSVVQGAAESAIAGGLIGAAQGHFGDSFALPGFKNQDGTPTVQIPVAAAAAGAAYAAALMFPQEEVAPTLKRAGDIGVGIWTASLAKTWVASLGSGPTGASKQSTAPAGMTGDSGRFGYDRIAELARQIPG